MAFSIGKDCKIHPSAVINVKNGFIGDGALILEGARIEGDRVEIGREAYIDRFAVIGGGSCFDPGAYLIAGDWLHMGVSSQINTARGVTVGHEFGCGIETKVFTHGAYIDSFNLGAPVQWAPVEIGDSVWLPNAWVNPGVKLGSHIVVAARSLINRDLPSGCLAGGVPVKILRENYFPRPQDLAIQTKLIEAVIRSAEARQKAQDSSIECKIKFETPLLIAESGKTTTTFNLREKTIEGPASAWSLMVKDQLRRNGIRFRYHPSECGFLAWKDSRQDR